ncbi:MAG: biotin--[acetyl-CoA-carboxylase] ligase [Chloroflexi bacterium]|nr:biotin--[acetyl-CoA-carboxylase] ligase [Chloroflexota bacterium]MDA1269900.1 biotin--[acetyl-CoA-carboxylase] ligase [Chloroflexota bacterium]PKB59495.1 MAG: biotin--[acetyl-CoA-carboxylase] ligase [SAR202 cluster bacterium Casp-Chloro-G2]
MPPNLVAATVRQGLFTRIVGRRLLYYPELASTMDEAAKLGEGDADEGAVVVAEVQTAGRGRRGRSWVSQPGNLLVSVLFRPSLEVLPFISIIGGVAAARAVRKVTGLEPKIKWPNDLLISGRKAAGILAESAVAGDTVWYAVLGLGMNVSLDTSQTAEISSFAVSVNAAAGREVPREDLLRQFLMDLDALYLALGQGDSPIAEWQDLLETTGQRVTATWADDSYTGLAEGTDELGNLLLRQDDGVLLTLTAGDVTLSGR